MDCMDSDYVRNYPNLLVLEHITSVLVRTSSSTHPPMRVQYHRTSPLVAGGPMTFYTLITDYRQGFYAGVITLVFNKADVSAQAWPAAQSSLHALMVDVWRDIETNFVHAGIH